MRLLVAVGLLAGCDRILGLDEIDPPPTVTDAPTAACLGQRGMIQQLCSPADLIGNVELGETINTDQCTSQTGGVQSAMPLACIVWGGTIHGGDVAVSGSLPLVLAATQMVTIDGVLDAGAHAGAMTSAPGAASCSTPATNGSEGAGQSGGGGGGGAYRGSGGKGGTAVDGSFTNGIGALSSTAVGLYGGCDGAKGGPSGSGVFVVAGGNGGGGGGAVYVLSMSIAIAGAVVAGGAGGQGGRTDPGGGGGGGGGGLVALDAPAIALGPNARLCANGGGGGGGGAAASPANAPGANGGDGCHLTNDAAFGGIADVTAGSGGPGSSGDTFDGMAGTSEDGPGGAGGGGGGAGHVVFYGDRPANAISSPLPE